MLHWWVNGNKYLVLSTQMITWVILPPESDSRADVLSARLLCQSEGLVLEVMFKTRAAVFYRDLKPRGAAEWF